LRLLDKKEFPPYVLEVNAQPSLEYGIAAEDCATMPLAARGARVTAI
jgi:hypothetical protein